MSVSTNVPSPTFGTNGFIIPQDSAILAGVLEDMQAAFGGNLNTDLTTPQGQLASSETAVISNANQTFLYYTNQVDPAYAAGRMQDGIARIYFIERNPAQPTTVQCVCTGLNGVVIPIGALAVATDGNLYQCTEAGTISVAGSVTLSFACQVTGAIACPAGTLNVIYQAVPGWDTIINLEDGVEGNAVESRSAFEARRALSVAHNSLGSLPSIVGAVLTVPNVIDAFVTENTSNFVQVVGGYPMAANSLYVAVVGGNTQAIAQAIWEHKAPGCAYNGNTTVVVLDENSGYSPPYPAYNVTFEIPVALPILFAVQIANGPLVPSDAVTQIQAAIMNAFAGGDGGPRARIGTELYASRYYAPVAALGSWVQIVSIEIGCPNDPSCVFDGTIVGNTLTVTNIYSGALTVGQTISDPSSVILPGTQITSFLSGFGGVGTYAVSVTQTFMGDNSIDVLGFGESIPGSEPFGYGTFVPSPNAIYASVANLFRVGCQIDQVPTINAANIAVSLV